MLCCIISLDIMLHYVVFDFSIVHHSDIPYYIITIMPCPGILYHMRLWNNTMCGLYFILLFHILLYHVAICFSMSYYKTMQYVYFTSLYYVKTKHHFTVCHVVMCYLTLHCNDIAVHYIISSCIFLPHLGLSFLSCVVLYHIVCFRLCSFRKQ